MRAIFDVSLEIFPGMVVWPGDDAVELARVDKIESGKNANVSQLRCGVHTGTHLDAPYHFLRDGKAIERLDLQALIGAAYVVELLHVDVVSAGDLETAGIPEGVERLLIHTRNSALWRTDQTIFQDDYVGLDVSGAEWLANRGVRLIGMDYLSVATRSQTKPVHLTLLSKEIVLVEGLNLDAAPAGACRVYCLPIKLRGSDGAPARVLLEVG
jgi:arylformamidase